MGGSKEVFSNTKMKDDIKGSALDEFLVLQRDGLSKHIKRVNELIPNLVQEIPPDKPVPRYGKYTLLHLCSRVVNIHYDLLFQYSNEKPIDCNVLDDYRCTPLYWACQESNLNAVQSLLNHGADPNIDDGCYVDSSFIRLHGWKKDSTMILKLLLSSGLDPNHKMKDQQRETNQLLWSLHWYYYCLKTISTEEIQEFFLFIQELLSADANSNFINGNGENALHIVCSHNDITFVATLVHHGCDYKHRNKQEKLPLDKITDQKVKDKYLQLIETTNVR